MVESAHGGDRCGRCVRENSLFWDGDVKRSGFAGLELNAGEERTMRNAFGLVNLNVPSAVSAQCHIERLL